MNISTNVTAFITAKCFFDRNEFSRGGNCTQGLTFTLSVFLYHSFEIRESSFNMTRRGGGMKILKLEA